MPDEKRILLIFCSSLSAAACCGHFEWVCEREGEGEREKERKKRHINDKGCQILFFYYWSFCGCVKSSYNILLRREREWERGRERERESEKRVMAVRKSVLALSPPSFHISLAAFPSSFPADRSNLVGSLDWVTPYGLFFWWGTKNAALIILV